MNRASAAPWIIIPYKEQVGVDRIAQLHGMLDYLDQYFAKQAYGMTIHIIACRQADALPWNAGAVFNAAVCSIDKPCTHVIMHSADTYPDRVSYDRHLGMRMLTPKLVGDAYYSSNVSFNYDSFVHVNGYSNGYWGWGSEDTDIMMRFVRAQQQVAIMREHTFHEEITAPAAFVLHEANAQKNHARFIKAWHETKGGTCDGLSHVKPATIADVIARKSYVLYMGEVDLSTMLVYNP